MVKAKKSQTASTQPEAPCLTEYELQREARIAQNQARLRQLGIPDSIKHLHVIAASSKQVRKRKAAGTRASPVVPPRNPSLRPAKSEAKRKMADIAANERNVDGRPARRMPKQLPSPPSPSAITAQATADVEFSPAAKDADNKQQGDAAKKAPKKPYKTTEVYKLMRQVFSKDSDKDHCRTIAKGLYDIGVRTKEELVVSCSLVSHSGPAAIW
jgi:hypothetical protein